MTPLAGLSLTDPTPLTAGLLVGATGKFHLLDLAKAAAQSSPPRGEIAQALLRAAYEADPADGDMAANLLAFDKTGDLPEGLRREAQAAVELHRRPDNLDYYSRLLAKRDPERLGRFLGARLDEAPDNLFWLGQASAQAFYQNTVGPFLDRAARFADRMPGLVGKWRGDAAFLAGDFAAAARAYGASLAVCDSWTVGLRYAESAVRLGRRDEAVARLAELVEAAPWDVQSQLRLHDLVYGVDRSSAKPSGSTAVLLYSYNKERDLAQTLDALAPSLPAGVFVRVLDNGSTDGTADLLRKWVERLGPERFGTVSLPVNIGAPAARNWLLSLPEVCEREFVAFLDDDAFVPPDWLERLFAAVAAYPRAGVWGAKVVDHAHPGLIQSADLFLGEPKDRSAGEDEPGYRPRFSLSSIHIQDLDFGRFDYLRPCASVTGCCHLFRREIFEETKGFDIRYTPTHFDDLDHDFRLCLSNRPPVYTGHLTIRHAKRTGAACRIDAKAAAGAHAHLYKLTQKFDGAESAAMRENALLAAGSDYATKRERLMADGILSSG